MLLLLLLLLPRCCCYLLLLLLLLLPHESSSGKLQLKLLRHLLLQCSRMTIRIGQKLLLELRSPLRVTCTRKDGTGAELRLLLGCGLRKELGQSSFCRRRSY
jgi:hypothetical protein